MAVTKDHIIIMILHILLRHLSPPYRKSHHCLNVSSSVLFSMWQGRNLMDDFTFTHKRIKTRIFVITLLDIVMHSYFKTMNSNLWIDWRNIPASKGWNIVPSIQRIWLEAKLSNIRLKKKTNDDKFWVSE